MSYFDKFNDIFYSFDGVGLLTVKDITFNVRPLKAVIDNYTLFEEYTIQDGDSPHIVSERVYGTPDYHWTIMLINEMYHYLNDWPMSDSQLEEYVKSKYGEDHMYDIHQIYGREHWVNSNNIIIDPPTIGNSDAYSVSNYEYETQINDAKRKIRIIHPSLIGKFVTDLENALNGE